jgi:hypothetical protein
LGAGFLGGQVIAESLRGLAVPVTDLRSLEGNPRRGDIQAVARSQDDRFLSPQREKPKPDNGGDCA